MRTTLLSIITFVIIAHCSVAQSVDSVIHQLNGCWRWDHYFGGFGGMPPRSADGNVHVEFFQDGQDSTNHTVSVHSYKNDTLKFNGRCNVSDTLVDYYLLSCPLFDSIGIVGTAPIYFNFENDTLLFPQQEFVDGFTFAFLQNCDDTTTQVEEIQQDLVHVYPNPVAEQLVISFKRKTPALIHFYNAAGVEVAAFKLKSDKLILDTRAFPEGVYLVRIQTPNGLLTKKVLVKR